MECKLRYANEVARQKKIKIIYELRSPENAYPKNELIPDEKGSFYAISKKGVRAKPDITSNKFENKVRNRRLYSSLYPEEGESLHSMRLSYSHDGVGDSEGKREDRVGNKQIKPQTKQKNPESKSDGESNWNKTEGQNERCRSKKQGKITKNRYRRTFLRYRFPSTLVGLILFLLMLTGPLRSLASEVSGGKNSTMLYSHVISGSTKNHSMSLKAI